MRRAFTIAALSVSLPVGVSASLLVTPNVTIARTAHVTVRVTRALLAPTLNHSPRHVARFIASQEGSRTTLALSRPSGVQSALRAGGGGATSTNVQSGTTYGTMSSHHCPGMSSSSTTSPGTTGK